MRITTAWAETASQNIALKAVVAFLTLACIVLSTTVASLALKEPLIIERGCRSEVIKNGLSQKTDSEVQAFVEQALQQRFDTSTRDTNLLSEREKGTRDAEQKSFREKDISQKLLVRNVLVSKNRIEADTDRIISVGKIRSAFSFPVLVELVSTPRSELNPYGLILAKVVEVKKDEKK